MKKNLNYAFVGLAALAFASCASDELVDNSVQQHSSAQKTIGFNVSQKNLTRATANLNDKGFYNFGVWAYKYSDVPSITPAKTVMDHYLVGYSSGNDNGKVGYNYKYDGTNTTSSFGGNGYADDGSYGDSKSLWFYEGLGSTQYTGGRTEDQPNGWIETSISTNPIQNITYWDKNYAYTNFYAYTPYMASGVSFSIDDGKGILQLPTGTLTAKMRNDDATKTFNSDDLIMYAGQRANNNVMDDVQLQFKHLGTRVRLAFYETIPGYTVKLKNLGYEANSTVQYIGVQATPAVKTTVTDGEATSDHYGFGKYAYKIGSDRVVFDIHAYTASLDAPADSDKEDDNIVFPISTTTDELLIADRNTDPNAVPTLLPQYYWAIPQNLAAANVGFTFHVTFDIISESTGEIITVHNARVYVDKENFNWKDGYQYTYVFKISHEANGNTVPANEGEFVSPNPSTDDALKPIVFDGITVDEWTETTDVDGGGNPDEFEIE